MIGFKQLFSKKGFALKVVSRPKKIKLTSKPTIPNEAKEQNLKQRLNFIDNMSNVILPTKKPVAKLKTELHIQQKQHIEKLGKADIAAMNKEELNARIIFKINCETGLNLLNLRTFFYSHIYVNQKNGTLLVSIDDQEIDDEKLLEILAKLNPKMNLQSIYDNFEALKTKFLKERKQQFDNDLDFLGLDYDTETNYKVLDSEKALIYSKYMQMLIANSSLYKCFCSNFYKCEQHCSKSNENIKFHEESFVKDYLNTSNINTDVKFLRYNNAENKKMKIQEYNGLAREYESSVLGDFTLFKNITKQFSKMFKSAVEDGVYNVTHKIEDEVTHN